MKYLDFVLFCIPFALYLQEPAVLLPFLLWLGAVLWEAAWLRLLHKRRGKESIYFFSDRGQVVPSVKIGKANNYSQRLSAHRTAAPFGIKVYLILRVNNSYKIEDRIHKRYHYLRIRKNYEWFVLTFWFRAALFLANLGRRSITWQLSR